ncbi:MAG: hypothetical protein OEZ15_08980 [Gammaproteobacteria bacterium]|nr:hypothetical protein [Gammaproteobacteria bacterium]
MISIFKAFTDFVNAEKTVYSHRNRTIEIIAAEKNIDIDSIKNDMKAIMEKEGKVEAVIELRKRFHLPLAAAWVFVDKLELSE